MKMFLPFLVVLLICTVVHSMPAETQDLATREVNAAHLGYLLGLKSEQKRGNFGMGRVHGFMGKSHYGTKGLRGGLSEFLRKFGRK